MEFFLFTHWTQKAHQISISQLGLSVTFKFNRTQMLWLPPSIYLCQRWKRKQGGSWVCCGGVLTLMWYTGLYFQNCEVTLSSFKRSSKAFEQLCVTFFLPALLSFRGCRSCTVLLTFIAPMHWGHTVFIIFLGFGFCSECLDLTYLSFFNAFYPVIKPLWLMILCCLVKSLLSPLNHCTYKVWPTLMF